MMILVVLAFKNKHIAREILFMRRNLEIKQKNSYLLGVHAIGGRLSPFGRTDIDPAICNPSRT
jgi:hypothetical protein